MASLKAIPSNYVFSEKDQEFYWIGWDDKALEEISPYRVLTVPEVLACLRGERKDG